MSNDTYSVTNLNVLNADTYHKILASSVPFIKLEVAGSNLDSFFFLFVFFFFFFFLFVFCLFVFFFVFFFCFLLFFFFFLLVSF